jgi:large subunit ribosomal protein L22
MGEVTAKLTDARVSLKHSVLLCKEIKGKKLEKAKRLLNDLIAKKRSLGGKYYTKTAQTMLGLLGSAEANAKFRGLAIEKLFIKQAKADKGYRFITPKSRFRFRRRRAKVARIEVVLEER